MITNREKFLKKHGLGKTESLSIEKISILSGMPVPALKKVYEKGVGAYYTNPESVRVAGTFKKDPTAPLSVKLSPQQWGMARVFSFVMKGKGTFHGADKHIAEEYNIR